MPSPLIIKPYEPRHVAWLVESVTTLLGTAQMKDIFASLVEDWAKLTGRDISPNALGQVYYTHTKGTRKMAAEAAADPSPAPAPAPVAEFKPRPLTPGHLVIAVHKATGAATTYQTLKEAIATVNGNASDFRFFEAREMRASYHSVLVIE